MLIDRRNIDTDHGIFRVTVREDEEYVKDVRDEWPNASDADVAAWQEDHWQFVTVTVERLCTCQGCGSEHVSGGDTLGMVFMGDGDGWTVSMDDLIADHPVPDMIEELKGK